jgi:hypothetical protein
MSLLRHHVAFVIRHGGVRVRRNFMLGVPVLLAAIGCGGGDEPAFKEMTDAERNEQQEKAKSHQSQHDRDGGGATTVKGQQSKAYKDAAKGGGSGGDRRGSGSGGGSGS